MTGMAALATGTKKIQSWPKGDAVRLALFLVSAILLSAFCLNSVSVPFVWLGWGWTLAFLLGTLHFKKSLVRAVLFNVAVLLAVLASGETYLTFQKYDHPIYSEPYFVIDDVLGTSPIKGIKAQASRFDDGKLLYNVTYSIDSTGLRVAPPSAMTGLRGSVLFFGCSFTFGEGLQDDETLPYQTGIQSGGSYKIYNFGFHGYGPNQMLAAIESGRVRQLVNETPRYAIYQMITEHATRVAGRIHYSKHSPRYELDSDGTARLRGRFDDPQLRPSAFQAALEAQLSKSAIYRIINSLEPRITEDDVRLLLATVRRSRDLLVEEYPGIEFHVILWRDFKGDFRRDQKICKELQESFAQMNIPVHLVENILPDYSVESEKYVLSPGDTHPNAFADRLIAQYVVTKILLRK